MPTAAFTTLGCKVNQYETQKILESFEQRGFDIVPFDAKADIYVVNSCSVTSDAESKSRYVVRRAKRTNPEARVVVTGCAAQMSINRDQEFDGADIVVPNPEKLSTLSFVLSALEPGEIPTVRPVTQSELGGRTRATLKVQDGCSVMCSYCSIPFTRPGMVSRPVADVLGEAKSLADAGYKEAILTGVLIGSYGPESGSGGPDFEELVELLAQQSGLARIRISSIEVHQVTDRLISLLEEGLVVPHLHVPLQSGDDGVLEDMNRRYRQADFLALCERLRKRVREITMTTDIMVGFPTETDSRFESTLHVCREANFLKAHVFRFSPRHGTPADAWGDPIHPDVKKERARQVSLLTESTGAALSHSQVGKTLRVLLEAKPGRDGVVEGTTDTWFTVKVAAPLSMCRTIQWVRIDESRGTDLFGEVVSEPALALTPR